MNYGVTLRRARKGAGHSLRTMSLAMGCSKNWISKLEADVGRPSLDLLECWAATCGVRLSTLVGYAEGGCDGQTQEAGGAPTGAKRQE